jgi:hypothetical protein
VSYPNSHCSRLLTTDWCIGVLGLPYHPRDCRTVREGIPITACVAHRAGQQPKPGYFLIACAMSSRSVLMQIIASRACDVALLSQGIVQLSTFGGIQPADCYTCCVSRTVPNAVSQQQCIPPLSLSYLPPVRAFAMRALHFHSFDGLICLGRAHRATEVLAGKRTRQPSCS